MPLVELLTDFSGWTSCHGVPHIGSSKLLSLKLFWGAVTLGATGLFVWQFYIIIAKFISYPVSVSTNQMNFPAVTLCNLNPYMLSLVTAQSATYVDLLALVRKTNANYTQAVSGNPAGTSAVWGFQTLNDTISLQNQARNDLSFVAASYTTAQLQAITTSFTTFVQSCVYSGKPCVMTTGASNSDFQLAYDAFYGACYTFNWQTPPTYVSNRPGPIYGFRVMLQTLQSDYLSMIESAGARVAIHAQTAPSFAYAIGLNAAIGSTTSFSVNYLTTERQPAPYGTCTQSGSGITYYYSGTYNVEGCYRSCYQVAAMAACNCADGRYAYPSGSTVCSFHNLTCISNFATPSISGFDPVSSCSCPPLCNEGTYSVTSSTALWPAANFVPVACAQNPSSALWSNLASCLTWMTANTLVVEVYFQTMSSQDLAESPSYALINLIADTGGQLGLWIGVSAITIVEYLSFICLLCFYCFSKVCRKKEIRSGMTNTVQKPKPPPPKVEYGNGAGLNADSFIPPKPVTAN